MPSGTPASTAMTSAAMTSSSVAGAAVPMSESTGRWVWIEVPQFPVTIPAKYLPIRTASGWSRPRYTRARAICAAEACGPAQEAAGSPGTTSEITNVRTTTPATTTTARATRRMTYRITRRRRWDGS